jgi:hypothetical protein
VEGLEIHETDDGLVIYQEASDRVHHLNQSAAAVFLLCDGSRDAAALGLSLQELFGLPEPPAEAVVSSLEQLSKEGLISFG